MTSKLKCPVCNVPLTACGDLLSCPNDRCAWLGNAELWQALIQAKQDLEIARKALESIRDDLFCQRKITARQALEQIEHKE